MSARGELEAIMTCGHCGDSRPRKGAWRQGWSRGYCCPCYRRWHRHGFPPGGPPPSSRPPRASRSHIGRIEDYADLRSWGVLDDEAAGRLGVSVRTVQRYKRAMAEAS